MKYIEMSVEDALKFCGKKGTVLVAVQDLENPDDIIEFVKKTKNECENVIRNASTIVKNCDDFMKQLNVYSYKQHDVMNIVPIGKVRTILIN